MEDIEMKDIEFVCEETFEYNLKSMGLDTKKIKKYPVLKDHMLAIFVSNSYMNEEDFNFICELIDKYKLYKNEYFINHRVSFFYLMCYCLNTIKKWKTIKAEFEITQTNRIVKAIINHYKKSLSLYGVRHPNKDKPIVANDILKKFQLSETEDYIHQYFKNTLFVFCNIAHADSSQPIDTYTLIEDINKYVYGENFKSKEKHKTTIQDKITIIEKMFHGIKKTEDNKTIKKAQQKRLIEVIKKTKTDIVRQKNHNKKHIEKLNQIIKQLEIQI